MPPDLPLERDRLSGAEAMALTLTVAPASVVVSAYLLDRVEFGVPPTVLLAVGLLSASAVAFATMRTAAWRWLDAAAWGALVAASFGWLMWIAAPSWLPLGSGSDLTHHILLVEYIERHWTLVHDPEAYRFLGGMAGYTPGSHVLAALVGRWSGVGGFHALHGVVAATVALKLGFVFLIALRVVASIYPGEGFAADARRVPFAALAVVLTFSSQVYLLRSFVENSFVAQVVSELFAVVMWWSLTIWHLRRALPPIVFAIAGCAAFLTWPVWIGPACVAATVLTLLAPPAQWRERMRRLLTAAAPMMFIVVLYMAGRSDFFGTAGVGGGAPRVLLSNYDVWFVVLSAVGMLLMATRIEGRPTALMAVAIGLQSSVLYYVAMRSHADAPYLALKMFYLLLYPQAVAAALAVAAMFRIGVALVEAALGAVVRVQPSRFWIAEALAAWLLLDQVGVAIARPLKRAPRSITILPASTVSLPLERAGQWARSHVPIDCVEYLVGLDETAYWLHLAVLGNPIHDARALDPDTYRPGPATIRWLTPNGLSYAIVDLSTISDSVRDSFDVLAEFDTAAVVKRRGPSACPQ